MNDIELSAKYFLEDLGINTYPIDPFEICKSLGIEIFEAPFDGLEGVLLFNGQNAKIGLDSKQTYLPRRKFSVSHELGHFNNDVSFGELKAFRCTKNMIGDNSNQTNDIEARADKFASEILLPNFLIKDLFNYHEPSWDIIKEVSSKFEVSFLSTIFKYIEKSKAACCLVVSKNNMIQFYKPSKTFRYSLQMNESRVLSDFSYASKAMKGLEINNDFELLSADTWISGVNVTKDSELYEWSMPLNSHDQVLTLLWDDETVNQADYEDNSNNPYDIKEKNYSYGGVDNFPWEPPTFGKKK